MKQRHLSHPQAVVMMLLTAILWSLGGLLIKKVTWHPLAIAALRSTIALIPISLILRKKDFTFSRAQIAAALSYTATLICFVVATTMTTSANAVLLQYTAPVYVAIFSGIFLKEKVTRFDWVTIIVTLAGISLFFMDHYSTENLKGNIFGVLAGVFFALVFLLMRKERHGSPLGAVFMGNILVGIVGIPFMIHSQGPTGSEWGCLIVLGLVQVGLAYVLYAKAIKYISALEAIMITMLEPILNPVWVFFFVGEKPGIWALIGGIIVVTSIVSRSIVKRR